MVNYWDSVAYYKIDKVNISKILPCQEARTGIQGEISEMKNIALETELKDLVKVNSVLDVTHVIHPILNYHTKFYQFQFHLELVQVLHPNHLHLQNTFQSPNYL
jgi:hypothetical protein